MKVLIVGGSGLIGGHAALHLSAQGHAVTLMARRHASPATPLSGLPMMLGDYLDPEMESQAGIRRLQSFDALIFAAGNDIRHVPRGASEESHWQRANVEGVPRFFRLARAAGIGRAIYIGSFYPQVAPQLVSKNAYVRGRLLADEGVRALSAPGFEVCSLNAPFVVGTVPGLPVPALAAHAGYALGTMPQLPVFAPPGGVNFISTGSLSQAIAGALDRLTPGKAYLVGDENLSFHDYFDAFWKAAGRSDPLPVADREHPLLPDSVLYAGRGAQLFYEPPDEDVRQLGYGRNDVGPTIADIVEFYRRGPG
jgi:nucleoside-diphosphate-sugar epimerase